jgi:hypothetical protein
VTRVLAVAVLLGMGAAAAAQERVVGLLTLPEVLGPAPCVPFTPASIPLHAAPGDGRPIGAIRVEAPPTPSPQGGCTAHEVRVERRGAAAQPLPTREYGYEEAAAIVLDRRGEWYRIRLDGGPAWIRPSRTARYLPLEALLVDRLWHLTSEWDGRLASSPGGALQAAVTAASSDVSARVVTTRRIGDGLWAEVDVLAESPCTAVGEPRVVARGWLPVHAASGDPQVWFYSRGC